MLTALSVKNFKSFGDAGADLQFAPLTILVGPNGSGKTSVLDAIAFLVQNAMTRSSQLTWQGALVDLGSDGRFAYHRSDRRRTLHIGMRLRNGKLLAQWQRDRKYAERLPFHLPDIGYVFDYNDYGEEFGQTLLFGDKTAARYTSSYSPVGLTGRTSNARLEYPILPESERLDFKAPTVSRVELFSPNFFQGSYTLPAGPELRTRIDDLIQQTYLVLNYIADVLRERVFIVGPERNLQNREAEEPVGNYVGRRGEHTLSLLSSILSMPQYEAQSSRIRQWATVFGLHKLGARWAGRSVQQGQGRGVLEAGYSDEPSTTPLPVEQAGHGSYQILPVITQLLCAPEHSLVMIEEPEISLHPQAQIDLLRMLADAVSLGRRILITTHSSTLLLALPEAAKEGKLKVGDVAIYEFSRLQGETTATPLDLQPSWYVKGWIPSFSAVDSRLIKDWIANVGDKIQPEN